MVSRKRVSAFQARRQRRIARRQQEIVTAAARIFAEQGYTHTTTKEIATAADMAEGTLYNYFDGKHAILLAILAHFQQPIDAVMENIAQLQTREDIVALVERGLDVFVTQLDFTRTCLTEMWVDNAIMEQIVLERLNAINKKVKDFITRKMEEGIFRSLDAGMVSQMILGMVLALILPIMRGSAPVPTVEERHALAETVVSLLLDGLRVRVFVSAD